MGKKFGMKGRGVGFAADVRAREEERKTEREMKEKSLMSEDDMFIFFRTHCCNGTVDCENSPECPTEDGCLPQQLAEKLKGRIIKLT